MIMPGRSCVAGMAIAELLSLTFINGLAEGQGSHNCRCGLTCVFYMACSNLGIWPTRNSAELLLRKSCRVGDYRQLKCPGTNPSSKSSNEVQLCEKANTSRAAMSEQPSPSY